jgi:hypothetical protein
MLLELNDGDTAPLPLPRQRRPLSSGKTCVHGVEALGSVGTAACHAVDSPALCTKVLGDTQRPHLSLHTEPVVRAGQEGLHLGKGHFQRPQASGLCLSKEREAQDGGAATAHHEAAASPVLAHQGALAALLGVQVVHVQVAVGCSHQ